ncbi:MAG: FHA domain-containing protein [Lachnospiraceae bacterium]|nr:FHA domain-containing protein [Lachnospiraceae bacterium]
MEGIEGSWIMEREVLQEGMGRYLKITGTAGERRSDKLFSYQELKGFLPLEIQKINGEKEYIYDISGRISLAQYLSQTDFTLEYIARLFTQLFDMIHVLEEYLLNGDGLVIQEEYLYVQKDSGELEGIYQSGQQPGVVPAVGKLLEFIMEKMNQKNRELVFFIYGMHKLTKEPGCTRGMLQDYVKRSDSQEHPGRESVAEKPVEMVPCQEYKPNPLEKRKRRDKIMEQIPAKKYLLPGLFLAAGLLVPVMLWRMGMFQKPLSGQMDWGRAAGAAVFFLGVAGYGAWKTLPERAKNVSLEEEESGWKNVCLIPRRGAGEPIPIAEFPCQIGREEGQVDAVLREEGISRVHARLLQEGGEVMVMDEESGSGTFHNEERLIPWQKKRLQDGDLLRFAGAEYVVEITQAGYVI